MISTTMVLTAALAAAPRGELVGKPCPPLELSHAVQGTPWSLEALEGRIAVIEFIDLAVPESLDHPLATLAKLAEQHKDDERVFAAAVATTWPAEGGGPSADDAAVRQALVSRRFFLPVMRDRGSASLPLLSLAGAVGTPRTLVLDAEGVVRLHGSNTGPESAAALEATVARLLRAFWVEPIEGLPPPLDVYMRGDLPRAGAAARKILADAEADPALRALAEQVDRNLEAGAKKLLDHGLKLRAAGYPGRARTKLENSVRVFAITPSAIEAARLLQLWRDDPLFKREAAGEVLLGRALALTSRPTDTRDAMRERLERLARTHGDTALGPRIQAALASLR